MLRQEMGEPLISQHLFTSEDKKKKIFLGFLRKPTKLTKFSKFYCQKLLQIPVALGNNIAVQMYKPVQMTLL